MIEIYNITECIEYLQDIEVVLFDLDDTLANEVQYIKSGYAAIAKVFPQIKNCAERLFASFEKKEKPINVVLGEEGLDTPDNISKALNAYREHKPDTTFTPGAKECLKTLRAQGKKLGVITDGRPDGQQAKIDSLRLEEFVDRIIITDSLGGVEFRKPKTKAFEIMQEYFKVPFSQMAYIGDNTNKDFIAPDKLGMKSIHFNNLDGIYR